MWDAGREGVTRQEGKGWRIRGPTQDPVLYWRRAGPGPGRGGILAEWEDRDLRPQLGRDVQYHSRASGREGKA